MERLYDRGMRRARKALVEIGEEFRHARLRLGLSQREVAQAARIDRADYSRIEAGRLASLTITVAARTGAVLGLDVSVRALPGGQSIRDAGHGRRMQTVIDCIGPPLGYRAEAPLPQRDGHLEPRSWDLLVLGRRERTAAEFEVKLYDVQSQQRRWNLKRRDDPVDHFLLVVADSRANRRVLAEHAELLTDLPRLRRAKVLATLRAGHHPPTGIVLL